MKIPTLKPLISRTLGSTVSTARTPSFGDPRRASRHQRGYGSAWARDE